MPKFTVLCRQDAYIDYTASIDAASAEEAAQIARSAPSEQAWVRRGEAQFDAALYVTLDDDGEEIADTAAGKCL
jgi:hypothetical protein